MRKWKAELETPLGGMKTSWLQWKDANWSGTGTSHDHNYGLPETIQQETVQGGRRRGRQGKRWEDNIKERTGLEWNIILRKAENREEAGCKIYSSAQTVSQTTG